MWDALIFAAEGYAKAAGRVGVCIATSGLGDTNLVTGLADGMMESIPLVAITGQVPRCMIGTDAFQATPIVEVTHAITKHNYLVLDIKDLPRWVGVDHGQRGRGRGKGGQTGVVIKEAFYLARSGRPGPVLVDVPKDIQQQLAVPDWGSPMSITGTAKRKQARQRLSAMSPSLQHRQMYIGPLQLELAAAGRAPGTGLLLAQPGEMALKADRAGP
ncbi:hypothetical protein GPECTOR_5g445 [Gonium pectorale]|uniref:Thiamine pyrophosphate enzyme N-terminal TPP-binding domain-containing protein n=1 Tax=Gonium pectorale TaxID=33097 RepID=A0A150GX33_GONPE|nr:hypothetical protein GPECTOR_5g445 [Gonium pectorale]|eukprot:KXZ54365.1 hypothetical protein GPECTOR_5g445 [Gonium pectorale]